MKRDATDRASVENPTDEPARFVPAGLLVQLAASHAAIGPFARTARETPQRAAWSYWRSGHRLPCRHVVRVA